MRRQGSAGASAWLVALLAAAAVLTVVGVDEAQAQRRGGDGFLKAGTTGSRFGLGALFIETTEVDADGNVKQDTTLGMSVMGGLSYAAFSRLALDLDAEFHFAFVPEIDLFQIELTPGARLFVLPDLYGRAAYAVRIKDPQNQLFLLGGGYIVRGRSVSVFFELNYVVTSQNEVDSRFIPRIGLSLAL